MARFEPNEVAIEELLTGPSGPVTRYVREFADRVSELAREYAPVDESGRLRDGIHVSDDEVVVPGKSIRLKVGTDPIDPKNGFGYGLVAHEGHGTIFAKREEGMAFFWFKRNRWANGFFEVDPTTGTPFLTEAVRQINDSSARVTPLLDAGGFLLEPGEHEGPIG